MTKTLIKPKTNQADTLEQLLTDKIYLQIPKAGDMVRGKILSVTGREIKVDLEGYRTGVIRGRELFSEVKPDVELKSGEDIEATVIELENENGEVELSLRLAGYVRTRNQLRELKKEGESASVKILSANKGGLVVELFGAQGFLPVSQLSPENYPRVGRDEKNKILEKLKNFVGQTMKVKIIDLDEVNEKLVVSEKAIWEERQKTAIAKYKIGDVVDAEVKALTSFGVFARFDNLEGLIHISEIAWQHVDNPANFVKTGQKIKAEIIGIQGPKIFLSIKKLAQNPWEGVEKKYKVGQVVEGKVVRISPFGLFVGFLDDIYGLAHISELSDKPVVNIGQIAKTGDVMKFKIVSLNPAEQKLGLSLRAVSSVKESDSNIDEEPA